MILQHLLTPFTKINSKWIKDLNVRLDTMKLLEENIGRTLYDINHSKTLFDPPPREMEIITKINSMVLAQNQTQRSVEQYKEPRNKPTNIWSPYL